MMKYKDAYGIAPDASRSSIAEIQALLNYYEKATIALHKTAPTGEDWKALDEAGVECEKLLGVPEEARK